MASHSEATEHRRPRRARKKAGVVLPVVGAACLVALIAGALLLVGRSGGASPQPTVEPKRAAPAVVSSSRGAPTPLARQIVKASQYAPGTAERAVADFAVDWGALAANGPTAAAGIRPELAAELSRARLLSADVGPARALGADHAVVPLALSVDAGKGPVTAALDASVARDPGGQWRLDAESLARALPLPAALAREGSVAQPTAPAENAALAALGDVMKAGPPASATTPQYPSGGLGLTEGDWQLRGKRDASGVRGWYGVSYLDGNVSQIEKTGAAGAAFSLPAARVDAWALVPDDAVPAGTVSVAGGDAVDLFRSPSLATRFRGGADSGRLYVRYHLGKDGVTGYLVRLGAP